MRDIAVHINCLIALRCFGIRSAGVNGGAGGGDVRAAVSRLVGPGWGGDAHGCVAGQSSFIEGVQQTVALLRLLCKSFLAHPVPRFIAKGIQVRCSDYGTENHYNFE